MDPTGLEVFGDLGALQVPLVMCMLVGWVVTCLCMLQGIKSMGKVVYFTATFPFLVMIVLAIAGLQLPGAHKVIIGHSGRQVIWCPQRCHLFSAGVLILLLPHPRAYTTFSSPAGEHCWTCTCGEKLPSKLYTPSLLGRGGWSHLGRTTTSTLR